MSHDVLRVASSSTRRLLNYYSSRAHVVSFLLVAFFAASQAVSANVSSSNVLMANEDPEVLVPLTTPGTGDDSNEAYSNDEFEFDNHGAAGIISGQPDGTSDAFRRSPSQTGSFAQAAGPFPYASSCPVPLEECVLPTTDYFEPLASWKLRSGHSFAPPPSSLTSNSTNAVSDATNCCLCDIAKVCFSNKGEYIGAQAIGDKFPEYDEYVLSGWCYALRDHYHELFTTEVDDAALITCHWMPDKEENSTIAVTESGKMATPVTVPATQSRATMTVARSPDQQYRADAEEDNDFETYISKLASVEEVVATSSDGTIVDEQGVSSEDEIDSVNEDVVQSDSETENSVGNTTSDDSDDSESLDVAVDDDGTSDSNDSTTGDDDITVDGDKGNSDSNESTGDDDSTAIVDGDDKGNSDSDSAIVEDDDNIDNGDSNGDDDVDISDDGEGEDSSDVSSGDDSGEAPATSPSSSPSPAPTTQGADSVRVTAFQGVATFEDLQVEEFSTDERNNFISTLADNANVDASFVRILLVSPGSVVVCWAVAFSEKTTLGKKELAQLLSTSLDASLVR